MEFVGRVELVLEKILNQGRDAEDKTLGNAFVQRGIHALTG